MADIKSVCKTHARHIKFNKEFLKYVEQYRVGWALKNDTHIQFLSGVLLGVHPIRFTQADEDMFYNELLEIDKDKLEHDLHRLADIHPERRVTSNVTYLLLTWLMHEFYVNSHMSKDNIYKSVRELYYIMAYKMFSSLMVHYFKYDNDRDIAMAVHEHLSGKFLIRKVKNWSEVFEYRANDLLPERRSTGIGSDLGSKGGRVGGLHNKRLISLTTLDSTRIIMDVQGRLRDNVKQYYVKLMEIKEDGNVREVMSTFSAEGEVNSVVIDRMFRLEKVTKHIYSSGDFLSKDLIEAVSYISSNVKKHELANTLSAISKYSGSNLKEIVKLVEDMMLFNISYLQGKGVTGNEADIGRILILIKGAWSGSKLKNESLFKLKKQIKKLISEVTGKKTDWWVTSHMIGFAMYITLKTYHKSN